MTVSILTGNCLDVLATLPEASVDSCVCDPPYHLTSIVKRFSSAKTENEAFARTNPTNAYQSLSRGFMGQTWDGGDVAFRQETWAAVFRVLKPGAHLLAFSGTRTYHRMACAIEDAGFEIRDSIYWHYGSGFPKSHNVINALRESGLACACPKTRVSHHHVSDENLCDLRQGMDAANALPVGAKSDVRQGVLGGADRSTEHSSRAKGGPNDAVRDLRETGSSAGVAAEAERGGILQHELPFEDLRGATEPTLGKHEGPEAGAAVRGEQPRMEGRCDAQASEGELHGSSLCAGAGVGAADGPEGRLHHGAPARDGEDVRLSPDQNGSGQSRGSKAGEQRADQSDALPNERGSQAWGGWPVCGGCGKPVVPEGLGTALKPATEPICVARKPLVGTVAANVLQHGTGALNIDATRIGTESTRRDTGTAAIWGGTGRIVGGSDAGRWPANLVHDGSAEVLACFPEAPGQQRSVGPEHGAKASVNTYGDFGPRDTFAPRNDKGSAARFFYCAKASKAERGEGNGHPTVKPIALMRWLVRLVTPPGGTVLDPFAGSGTTGIAAGLEQFRATLIEMDPKYAGIAQARLNAELGMFARAAE